MNSLDFFTTSMSSSLPSAISSISESPVINFNAPFLVSMMPGSNGCQISETTTLFFSKKEVIRKTLSDLDKVIVELVVTKFESMLEQPLYPSQIAKLVFELAFTDPDEKRLSPAQRTQNMGYILSCLGCNKSEIVRDLFAFYYGYSFKHFATEKKESK